MNITTNICSLSKNYMAQPAAFANQEYKTDHQTQVYWATA